MSVNWQMAFFSHTFLLGPLKVIAGGGFERLCVCVCMLGACLGQVKVLGGSGIVFCATDVGMGSEYVGAFGTDQMGSLLTPVWSETHFLSTPKNTHRMPLLATPAHSHKASCLQSESFSNMFI